MPRFVILEHDHPELHWDLMLEAGAVLRTWRLARPPETIGDVIPATALGDHRLAYLDYEGPVSGGRGHVRRWDGGTYVAAREEETLFEVRFEGELARGMGRLRRGDGGAWVFEWWGGADEGAGPANPRAG